MVKRASNEPFIDRSIEIIENPPVFDSDWRERERWHSAHSATPLNSRQLITASGRPYVHEALDYVNEIVHDAALASSTMSPRVFGQLEVAVQGALFARIEENEQKTIPLDCDQWAADAFERACVGVASLDDLVKLLALYPDALRSLEIAKQTVAGNLGMLNEMDAEVGRLLYRLDMQIRDTDTTQNVRYSIARVDDTSDAHAVTIVRKADRAVLALPQAESVKIVQRDNYVIDLDANESSELRTELNEWLRQPQTKSLLRGNQKARYRGGCMSDLVESSDPSAATRPLLLAVRSYYAHTNPRR